MQRETIYHIQSSFATGEISPEVANRIDLDKYAAALLIYVLMARCINVEEPCTVERQKMKK